MDYLYGNALSILNKAIFTPIWLLMQEFNMYQSESRS